MAPHAQDIDHPSAACHTYISSNGQKLKIIIIGAGIAGLSAAIGLRYAGHDVEVSLHLATKDPIFVLLMLF